METIKDIWFEGGRIYMESSEGKVYSRPLEAFPTLKDASETERDKYTICIHGETVRWAKLDEDIHISSFYEKEEPERDNEIARIFNRFPQLNVSEVARSLNINKSLLAKYIYGIKKPSEERVLAIKEALHSLGREFVAV